MGFHKIYAAVLFAVVILAGLSFAWPTKRTRSVMAGSTPSAPSWPQWWSAELVQFSNISRPPPYTTFPDEPTAFKSTMRSFYDWTTKSMIEEYDADCVPIFPDFSQRFSCKFHNGVDHVSYILTGNDRPKGFPGPCCLFANPWFAPPPNFATLYMWFNGTNKLNGRGSAMYTMNTGDVGGGAFFYEYYNNSGSSPAMFAFPGLEASNGFGPYIAQFYLKFSTAQPDPSMFETPAQCKGNIPACPSPGGIPVSLAPPHSGHGSCIYPGAPEPAPQGN